MRARGWAGLVLATSVGAVACQVLAGIEQRRLDSTQDAGVPDVRMVDASPAIDAFVRHDAGIADVGTCDHAFPPPAPATDTPTGANVSFYVALKTLTFADDPSTGIVLGYDLDGVCSVCPNGVATGGPFSCARRTAVSTAGCDLSGGRDLAGNSLLGLLNDGTFGSNNIFLAQEVAQGKAGLILKILDYNAGSDDTNVALTVFVSSGIIPEGADASVRTKPNWDGNDVWSIDPSSVQPNPQISSDGGYDYVPIFFATGYVSGNTLVAELPTLGIALFGGETIAMTGAVVSATLTVDPTPAGAGYQLVGQLTGRVSTFSLLRGLSAFTDPSTGRPFCGDDAIFETIKGEICKTADILADPTNLDASTPCDAVSMAFGFTAYPAKIGAPGPPVQEGPMCDGGVQDCPAP